MLMMDSDIKKAIEEKRLEIRGMDDDSFKPVAYIARFGKKCLVSGNDKEIDVAREGSVTLQAGDFALFVTEEYFKLSDKISGHIGIRSFYARRGVVLLAGMHIDPLWEGHLVLGVYNASPRQIVLDYLTRLVVIEFHQLNKAPTKIIEPNPEQKSGRIPEIDKAMFREMETHSLSQLSQELRELTKSVADLQHSVAGLQQSVAGLEKQMKIMMWAMGMGFTILAVVVGVMGIGY